jgi:multiple sugar transport system permease protein
MTTIAVQGEQQRSRPKRWFKLLDLLERWAFILPTIVILVVMLAYPIFYTFQISFSRFDLSTFGPGQWVGLDNYIKIMSDYRFWESLKVTGIYLLWALPIQIILGFGIAYLVNAEWKGRSAVRAAFLIPLVVAPVIAGGMWKMILDPLWGLANYALSFFDIGPVDWFGDPKLAMVTIIIIDTWRWTPFVVLIASAGLLALPRDVFEAAKIDGANWWSTLWSVAIPLLVPVIAATFVIRWLGAAKMFDIVLTSTRGGPGGATGVINLFIYEEAFRSLHFAESATMAVIVLIITMILTGVFLYGSRKLEEAF